MNECRSRIYGRKAIIQLLYFCIALLIHNVQILFERKVVMKNGRGRQSSDGYISIRDILLVLMRRMITAFSPSLWKLQKIPKNRCQMDAVSQ